MGDYGLRRVRSSSDISSRLFGTIPHLDWLQDYSTNRYGRGGGHYYDTLLYRQQHMFRRICPPYVYISRDYPNDDIPFTTYSRNGSSSYYNPYPLYPSTYSPRYTDSPLRPVAHHRMWSNHHIYYRPYTHYCLY